MTGRPAIPNSLDDITPEWLLAAFAAEGMPIQVDSQFTIRELTETSGQDGIYGVVDAGVSDDSGPKRLFIKLLDLPAAKGGFFLHQQAREHHFYRVFGHRVTARVPRFYYGDYSSDFRQGVLIIESLDGWQMGSAAAGIDQTRAMAIGRELGLLNGSTLNSPLLEMESSFIRYTDDSVVARQLAEGYGISLDTHRQSFADWLSPDFFSLVERIRDNVIALVVEVRSGDASINQGDCRVDNMAFRQAKGQEQAALFDFGLTTIGDGMADLSQCVTSAWPDATENDLYAVVGSYHHALQESGDHDRSLDEAWERFRRSMLFALITRIFSMHMLPSLDSLSSGTPLERMRIHTWKNVMRHCEQMRIWELY